MTITNSYNYRQLSVRHSSSGVVGANRLKGLAAEGYETVINLLPNNNEHAVASEQQTVETQGLNYVYIPVDWNSPSLDNYQQFTAAMQEISDQKIHIHCAANWRVSGFYGAYALSQNVWTVEQAKIHIQGLWQPSDYPQWQGLLAKLGLTF